MPAGSGMETGRPNHTQLKALPWVSLGLVCTLLLSFVVVELGFGDRLGEARDDLDAAVDFAIENPTVRIDSRLLPVIRDYLPNFEGNDLFEFLKQGNEKEQIQQEFDVLLWRGFRSLDSHPHRSFGVVPASPSVIGFLAHPFVHVGWLHLLGTVALLLLVGPLLEETWGRGLLVGTLAASALVGAGAFALVHGGADRPLLGAAGIVSGLVAAALVRFGARDVNLLRWLAPLRQLELRAPVWLLGSAWIGYEVALWEVIPGELSGSVDTAVGYTAHAAAAVVGGVSALLYTRFGLETRLGGSEPPALEPAREEAPFDLQKVFRARTRGDADQAYAMLIAEMRRSARNRDAVMTFWEMSIERSETERAVPAMLQLVSEELRRGAGEVAVAHWRELVQHAPEARVEPTSLLRLVPFIRSTDGDEPAVLALQQAMDSGRDGPTAAVAAEIARLAADLDADLTRAAAEHALADPQLDPARRAELDSLVNHVRKTDASQAAAEPKQDLPANAFYEEQDRSGFGEVVDLTEFGSPGESFPEDLVFAAIPVSLDADGITLECEDGTQVRVAHASLSVVSVAGVHGLGPKPIVLIDLFTATSAGPSEAQTGESPLRIYRLRCDRFDPRRLVAGAENPLSALRALLDQILQHSQARPLPDSRGARANPVSIFDSLGAYQASAYGQLDL